MEKTRLQKLVSFAMVALGLVQAGLGVLQDDTFFALFGLVYALIGCASLWFNVYASG